MSIEKRRRFKKKAKSTKQTKGKRAKKERVNPKKAFTPEELEAKKRAQRLGMFDKKRKTYKKLPSV